MLRGVLRGRGREPLRSPFLTGHGEVFGHLSLSAGLALQGSGPSSGHLAWRREQKLPGASMPSPPDSLGLRQPHSQLLGSRRELVPSHLGAQCYSVPSTT